ncbi:hypothetical protein LTR99_005338 [Exophiala xenobiotica]|uniref:Calcineurin-like phosphoesterase domain-containing protein n=1 Tax=Vermiconidia calcicola TaxID=1690605 RepID=A0AAV9Q7Z6_9PEZI|nr:hypothetical protein LTR72_003197 [Exophiala xenobiotica]KAK5535904.1 hypothetical protein LTR25_005806 [Vermiconidia calcicola]KAK5548845.1 hypothetical protein LTR23_001334 [Chaetothyriales sp. CCFEE 6169]KAK5270896.1 hypothetical protein LTR96_004174 [Exophiala xenobiotica]KAK5300956.1 hypothetical protein LTR14_001354 [Exophiala xenobiotica]
MSELEKTVNWLVNADFKAKILVCGNHDVTADVGFYREYGAYFHNKKMEDPQKCLALLQADPSIIYLNHESKQIRITHNDGAVTSLKVFGSPYSPARGLWAFGYPPEKAAQLWAQIALDSDIVVTHTPAKFHRDECGTRGTAGCETLRQTLWRVRPRLFVCGHIHEAYGVEVVSWDLSSPNIKFKEGSVRYWQDPHPESKKQYTVDLSSRAKAMALRNDGSVGNLVGSSQLTRLRGAEVDGPSDGMSTVESGNPGHHLPGPPTACPPPFPEFDKAQRPISPVAGASSVKEPASRGQGGPSSSARSDQEAISGRQGRVETCIVNAAYMATNWPHKTGKKFHKPVVVDLDLPVEAGQSSASESV